MYERYRFAFVMRSEDDRRYSKLARAPKSTSREGVNLGAWMAQT